MFTFIRLYRMYRKHGFARLVAARRASAATKDLYGDVVGRAA